MSKYNFSKLVLSLILSAPALLSAQVEMRTARPAVTVPDEKCKLTQDPYERPVSISNKISKLFGPIN